MEKTIAAISTPPGCGGIGIVRISGDDAIAVADRVFCPVSGIKLSEKPGYSASFGRIEVNGRMIDEAVAVIYRAPKSYTGEDTVEFDVHGGELSVKEVLRAVLDAGAYPADRGEFTKRAYLNGKMELCEAEAVMDIISASSEQALRAGLELYKGAAAKRCIEIKEKLTFAAATVAAFSDFPDEEPEFSGIDKLGDLLDAAHKELKKLIDDYDTGRMIKTGINTVIVGPPNAGKSTLMNLLSGFERSIVTSVPGTTRDTVEETVNIDGITLRLCDTAGIRETSDTVEKIGVDRAKEKSQSADLIIAVIDSTDTSGSEKILAALDKNRTVAVFNKSDITVPDTKLAEKYGLRHVILSALNGSGLDELCGVIKELTVSEAIDGTAEVFLNERQRGCAVRAEKAVSSAINDLNTGMTVDAVGVMIDDAIAALMELTGERVTTEVANEVFRHFCVGK